MELKDLMHLFRSYFLRRYSLCYFLYLGAAAIATPAVVLQPSHAQLLTERSAQFNDTITHWAAACIEGMGTEGLMSGYLNGQFRPDGTMTRTEFAAVMVRAFPDAPNVREAPDFADVEQDFWGRAAIATAYEKGFLSGYPNNRFRPAQPITRAQAVIVIANAQKLSPPANSAAILQQHFEDATAIPDYAKAMLAAATRQELVVNYPKISELRPNASITRGEATALLCRLNSAGTDARYYVPAEYVANFGNGVDSYMLKPGTILKDVGRYGVSTSGLLYTTAELGDRLFFFLSNNVEGAALWGSDATAEGTRLVGQLWLPEEEPRIESPEIIGTSDDRFWILSHSYVDKAVDDQTFTDRIDRLWSSDGTEEGTREIRSLNPALEDLFGMGETFVSPDMILGDRFLFVATAQTSSQRWIADSVREVDPNFQLWITDGESELGTQRLATFATEPNVSGDEPDLGPVAGDYLFFQTERSTGKPVLWRTDGTPDGTIKLTIESARLPISDIVASQNQAQNSAQNQSENRIYMAAETPGLGWEPWTSDGTPSGTRLLKDIYVGESGSVPRLMTSIENTFFMLANTVDGYELWATQGTSESTRLVKQISARQSFINPNPTNSFIVHQGKLYFKVLVPQESDSGESDYEDELWVTDGTAAGTERLAAVEVLEEGFTAFKGQLFFGGTAGDGQELWVTDGTAAGTRQVIDFAPGVVRQSRYCPPSHPGERFEEDCSDLISPRGALVRSLTPHGDHLYFFSAGIVYRTDGTAAGIQQVKDFAHGPFLDFPPNIVRLNDSLIAVGFDGDKMLMWALPE